MAKCQLLSWPQDGRHRVADTGQQNGCCKLRAGELRLEAMPELHTEFSHGKSVTITWHWRAEGRTAWARLVMGGMRRPG